MIDVFSVLLTSSYLLNSIVYLEHSEAEQLTSIPNIVNMNRNEKTFDHHELPTFRLNTNTSSNINDKASSCLQNNVTPESHGKLFKVLIIYKFVQNQLKQNTRCFHLTLTLCKNFFKQIILP